jgi:hypothetical protein
MTECTDICVGCLSIYYILNCCLFSGACIREKYMDNDCSGFFKRKFRKYYQNIPENDEIEYIWLNKNNCKDIII